MRTTKQGMIRQLGQAGYSNPQVTSTYVRGKFYFKVLAMRGNIWFCVGCAKTLKEAYADAITYVKEMQIDG